MAYRRYDYGPQSRPGYDPYSKYPDIGSLVQTFMQNMIMQKQMRQGQQQQMWQRGMREKEFGLQEKRLAQEKPPTQQQAKWSMADANVASGEWTPEQGQTYKLTGKIPTPRVKYPATTATNVKGMFKITDEEWKIMPTERQGEYFKEFHLRSRPKAKKVEKVLTPEEKRRRGASTRDGNLREMRDFYKGIPELIDRGRIKPNELRKMIKKQGGGIPTSPQGYRLDMPEKYNRAILNQRDGVATEEDTNTIKNYENMFKIFQDELKVYPTFKDWLRLSVTTKLKGLDKNQMKIWYDVYAEKESWLEKRF
jgi:hypothetical protein